MDQLQSSRALLLIFSSSWVAYSHLIFTKDEFYQICTTLFLSTIKPSLDVITCALQYYPKPYD
jgi:hypothetical protein